MGRIAAEVNFGLYAEQIGSRSPRRARRTALVALRLRPWRGTAVRRLGEGHLRKAVPRSGVLAQRLRGGASSARAGDDFIAGLHRGDVRGARAQRGVACSYAANRR